MFKNLIKGITDLAGKKAAPATDTSLAATMPIVFYKDTNGLVEHGSLYVSHASQRLTQVPVPFSFVDLAEPPAMTPEILSHIEDMAERQGYEVHSLRSYATLFPVQPAPRMHIQGNAQGRIGGVARTPRRPTNDAPRRNHQHQAA